MPDPKTNYTTELVPTGDATALLPVPRGKPITVIGTEAIRATFDMGLMWPCSQS